MHASSCIRLQSRWFAVISTVLCLTATPVSLSAQTELHQKINQTISSTTVGSVADPVDDFTFARRIHLDLIGRIPSAQETRTFVDDASPEKRQTLVDQLLNSDDYSRHMATVFDVMLMERRGGKHVKSDAFRSWLQSRFEQNKPFHELAGELIAAESSDGKSTAAAFLLERDVEPNLLTREISRMFFGRDVQCAQCHDHPNVGDYKQEDYYGIYAFVNRTSLFQPDKKKPAVLSEVADGQAPFKSVFTDRSAFTAPRLPGSPEIVEPMFVAGDEYKTRPAKTVAAVPKFSRRQKLAELIASGDNQYFRRNIANRLWALMMGRGLVHPVDMHHSSNPPSNPELMTLIADEFASMNFDIKSFLRQLALSNVYQQSHLAHTDSATADQLTARIRDLDQQRQTAEKVAGEKENAAEVALEQLDKAIAETEPIRTAWTKARSSATSAAKKRADAAAAATAKESALKSKTLIATNLNEALKRASEATEILNESKELSAAAATIRSRVTKLTAETQKLQKESDAAAKAEAAASDVLVKANGKEQEERKKYTPLRAKIREHRTLWVTALRESQDAYETVSSAENRTEQLQNTITRRESSNAIPQTKQQLSQTENQQRQASESVTIAEREMADASEKVTAESTSRDEMQKRITELDADLNRKSVAQNQLSEALRLIREVTSEANKEADTRLTEIDSSLRSVAGRVSVEMSKTQTAMSDASTQMASINQRISELSAAVKLAEQKAAVARKQAADAREKVGQLRNQLEELTTQLDDATASVEKAATANFQRATVESLTPEQLAWSILYCSGQADRQVTSELAQLNKKQPLNDEQKKDPKQIAARQMAADAAARETLEKSVATFVTLFGLEPGQPQDSFFATVDQALFFANGSQIRGWLTPVGDNLTGRMLNTESAEELANDLYLSTLVRMPSPDEVRDVEEYLAARGENKRDAVQELAWALITSAEFRFQY